MAALRRQRRRLISVIQGIHDPSRKGANMGLVTKRASAAVGTVVVATVVNLVTGVLTQRSDLAWWITLAVLVVVGGGLQAWLTVVDTAARQASRNQCIDGAIVEGSIKQVMSGSGNQRVSDSETGGDLSQEQWG
jgi:hypothetical protein